MTDEDRLRRLMAGDAYRMRILHAVHALGLPDGWIGAGFVRNAVWDALHGIAPRPPDSDIDVIWFDPADCSAATDEAWEARLRPVDPALQWSVRNQARMHLRNGDAPYASSTDAMNYWPETATAVAVRCTHDGDIEIAAPLGLADVWEGIVRPTPAFAAGKQAMFTERVTSRRWLQRWPRLRLMAAA